MQRKVVAESRIVNGKVELEVPGGTEGATVTVSAVISEEQPVVITEDEKRWLLASIASGEADNGRDFLEILNEMKDEESRV